MPITALIQINRGFIPLTVHIVISITGLRLYNLNKNSRETIIPSLKSGTVRYAPGPEKISVRISERHEILTGITAAPATREKRAFSFIHND